MDGKSPVLTTVARGCPGLSVAMAWRACRVCRRIPGEQGRMQGMLTLTPGQALASAGVEQGRGHTLT